MRWISDFLSGAASPFGRTAYTTPRFAKGQGFKHAFARNSRRKPALVKFLRQASMMTLIVSIGALAFFAVSRFAAGNTYSDTLRRNIAEALAIDPSCRTRDWKYIILHHSASVRGSAQTFDEWHRARGWRCLGYDFVIGNGQDQGDGFIVAGPRWYRQESGAHANSNEYNEHGIGICLVGNFEERPPTPAQWNAVRALVRELRQRYHISSENIAGHNQIRRGGSTACPGRLFPLQQLRDED